MTPHDVELTNIARTLATRPDLAQDPGMREAIKRLDEAKDCQCLDVKHRAIKILADEE